MNGLILKPILNYSSVHKAVSVITYIKHAFTLYYSLFINSYFTAPLVSLFLDLGRVPHNISYHTATINYCILPHITFEIKAFDRVKHPLLSAKVGDTKTRITNLSIIFLLLNQ